MLVIGHKGASSIAPENTLKSFQKAIKLNADYIEFDIHKTFDNEIVIMHDADTLATTGVPGLIREMTLEDIKKLDAGDGEKVPTLKELIYLAKDKLGLQVEIKAIGLVDQLISLLKKNDIIESTIVSCFEIKELLKIKAIEPEIRLGYLIPGLLTKERIIKRYVQRAIDNKFFAVHPHYQIVNQEFVDFAHENELKVNVWTVNDEDKMQQLKKLNVDGIFTDDIALLNRVLGRTQ
jgi:glycerophosphoryl diester phosphodiesterase